MDSTAQWPEAEGLGWEQQDTYERQQYEEQTMGRYATQTGGNFTPAPAGTHVARCFKLVDIGTQHDEYQGKPSTRNQFIAFFELPNELMTEGDSAGKPFIVAKFYTNSLNEKSHLYGDLISWRGREFTAEELEKFDLNKILGVACMISVVHTDKGRAKIATISGVPKGMTCPPQVNPSFSFWLDAFDQEKFDSLSENIQNLIKKSDEYKALGKRSHPQEAGGASGGADFDDDIPF